MQIVPQWMKLDTNILHNNKIKKIRRMPEGDSIFTLWIYLICEGMKNIVNPGVIELTAGVPMSFEDIADDANIKVSTVQLGIKLFIDFHMIFPDENGSINVKNLSKHQSLEQLEYRRKLKTERQQRWRDNKKLLLTDKSQNVDAYETSCRHVEKKRKEKNRVDQNKEDNSFSFKENTTNEVYTWLYEFHKSMGTLPLTAKDKKIFYQTGKTICDDILKSETAAAAINVFEWAKNNDFWSSKIQAYNYIKIKSNYLAEKNKSKTAPKYNSGIY